MAKRSASNDQLSSSNHKQSINAKGSPATTTTREMIVSLFVTAPAPARAQMPIVEEKDPRPKDLSVKNASDRRIHPSNQEEKQHDGLVSFPTPDLHQGPDRH
jgi:hypothetical protein